MERAFLTALTAGAALLFSSLTTAQGVCTPSMSVVSHQMPPVGGMGVTTDVTYSAYSSLYECGLCRFAWDVEADWEYPWPIPKGSVHICASGGGHFACSPVVLEDTTGSAPPPYTYHFESITSGFEVRCPGRLQLSLEWNPGLGFLPIVQLDLRCNGC
jgi:hypothetical protein